MRTARRRGITIAISVLAFAFSALVPVACAANTSSSERIEAFPGTPGGAAGNASASGAEASAEAPQLQSQLQAAANPNAIGRVKYRLDAASFFGRYGNAQYAPWVDEKIALIKGYPPASDRYPELFEVPVIGYHDAATEGYAPLTASSIEAYEARVKRDASLGYEGTFLDDINWSPPYRDGHQSRSLEPELHELAKLVEATRAAIPNGLIELNSQYHDIWPLIRAHNAYVEAALGDVNLVTKEFGVGPTAQINTAQDYEEFFEYVEYLHAKGVHVMLAGDPNSHGRVTEEYNLATYFLINDGSDYVNGERQRPHHWWRGFSVDLGEALGPRERLANGVWRREFSGGIVYTVSPGYGAQTIQLPQRMRSAAWGKGTSVTLAGGQGAVLTYD